MKDPMDLLLPADDTAGNRFPETSRYHTVETTTREEGGRTVVYLKRRFVPPPENFAVLHEHTVIEGQRLDQIAAHYLGDAERFWQLADAARALDPEGLTEEPGDTLDITLPEGIPGPVDD